MKWPDSAVYREKSIMAQITYSAHPKNKAKQNKTKDKIKEKCINKNDIHYYVFTVGQKYSTNRHIVKHYYNYFFVFFNIFLFYNFSC